MTKITPFKIAAGTLGIVALAKVSAFAIALAPSVALIFGVHSLWEAKPDRWDNAMVLFGAVGAAALVGMNAFAISELIDGRDRADEGLIRLGIGVGLGYVSVDQATPDTEIFIDVRGRSLKAAVSKLPFI